MPAAPVRGLIEDYGLSDAQADAILQMQLRRLTALEAEKIQLEHEDLQAKIADCHDILERRERRLDIIETELTAIKEKFTTPRQTMILAAEGELGAIDLIANEQAIILVTEQGYIKRMPLSTFEAQSRATRGRAGAKVKEDDAVEHFFACNDHDSVLFFSDRGVVYCLHAYQVPMGSRTSRGTPIVQLLPIPREEKITSVIPVSEFSEDEYLVMMTAGGYIKKTALAAFSNIRSNGLIAISLAEGDQLRWVRGARVEDSIVIGSRQGMAIHFRADHQQLRPLGRATRGVRSMKLRSGDELIGMDILPSSVVANLAPGPESEVDEGEADLEESTLDEAPAEEIPDTPDNPGPWVLVITTNGYGKRVPISQFRLQNRAGKGLTAIKFKSHKQQDQVAALRIVNAAEQLVLVTSRGIVIRQRVEDISSQSRAATGVRVQRLDDDDSVVAVALVPPEEITEEDSSDGEESSE